MLPEFAEGIPPEARYLADDVRDYLYRCAIADEIIDGRPYLTLTDALRQELVETWGFHPAQVEPSGIAIFRYDVVTGKPTFPQVRYHEERPDADGDLKKYCAPKDSGGVVDAYPPVRDRVLDTLEALWIAESVKGGDALLTNGALAVSIFGVGGYSKDRQIAEAFDAIPLRRRTVNVAFDADVRDRDKRGPVVQLGRLCHYLAWARGANVNVAELPFDEAGEKQGIDDTLPEVG